MCREIVRGVRFCVIICLIGCEREREVKREGETERENVCVFWERVLFKEREYECMFKERECGCAF